VLNKSKESETFEAPNCQQEEETNDDRENSGDSTLVNFDKLEEFEPREEHQEKNQQEEKQEAVDKPETQDKGVQTMDAAEIEATEKNETAHGNGNQSHFLDLDLDEKFLNIFMCLILVAAFIMYYFA
jgi:hypothetical protein